MTVSKPTKAELIEEVERLRRRIAELEAKTTPKKDVKSPIPPIDEQLLEALADIMPVGVYVYRNDELLFANRAAYDIVGMDQAKTTPGELLATLLPEYADLVRKTEKARKAGHGAPESYEIEVTAKSGNVVWLLLYGRLIEFRGAPASLGVAMDVTEHRQTEAALQASQTNLQAIFESTDDYILLSDNTGSPVYFNTAYANIMKQVLGIEMKPGLKPHTFLEDPAAQEQWRGFHRRVLSGERFSFEYPLDLIEGEPRYLHVSYYPIEDNGEVVGFCEYTHDITDWKKAQAELARTNERLTEQLRRVAGSLTHEISNALYPANTTLHKLQERLAERSGQVGQERNLRVLDIAMKSIERAIGLTESVRLFSKLDPTQIDEYNNLLDTIESVLRENNSCLLNQGVTIQIEVSDNLSVRCPQPHLHSIIDNLLQNSVEAMRDTDQRRFSIKADISGELIVIVVTDTGEGITPENMPHIFEPFWTTNTTTGTGLGLSIVQRVVNLCGGTVDIQSTRGTGTTVVLSISGMEDSD